MAAILMVLLKEKTARTGKFQLTDDELWCALKSSGVVRGCRSVMDQKEKALTKDDALLFDEKQVIPFLCYVITSALFCKYA